MKRRLGFVSNSSSSSFVIIGQEVGIGMIEEDNVFVKGGDLYEGELYFQPSKEIIDYLQTYYKENYSLNGISLIKEFHRISEDQTFRNKKELIKIIESIPNDDSIDILSIKADYYQPEDLDKFINYIGE